jgi:hypothetical protein
MRGGSPGELLAESIARGLARGALRETVRNGPQHRWWNRTREVARAPCPDWLKSA